MRVLSGIQPSGQLHLGNYFGAMRPQIEMQAHVQHLVDAKRAARAHRACDRLAQAAPASSQLLQHAGARGENLGSITVSLMRLLDRWGAGALQAAITEALARGVPHPNAVRLSIERQREAHAKPPVAVLLPAHLRSRDVIVRPHDLAPYDRIKEPADATDPD